MCAENEMFLTPLALPAFLRGDVHPRLAFGVAMKLVMLIFLAALSMNVFAEKSYSKPNDLFAELLPKGAEIKLLEKVSDLNGDGLGDSYGVLLYRLDEHKGIYVGRVFVLLKTSDGRFRLSGISNEFGCCDFGKTYIETIQKSKDGNFFIQFNESSYCGTAFTLYRFKLIENSWRVTGRDHGESSCDAKGLSHGWKTSRNFLTGKAITANGKAVNTAPVTLFLDQFDPWDRRYYGE